MIRLWWRTKGTGCCRGGRRVGLVIFLLAGVTCFAKTAAAQGGSSVAGMLMDSAWPKYRQDAGQAGRSDHNGPQSERLMWTFSTGKREAEGGIETDATIGPDGTVYVGANNGIFYALDGRSGDVKWVFPTQFETYAIYSTAAIDKTGRIYFGAKDGFLYVLLPPQTGILARVVWRYRVGTTIETSPALGADGTVYIGADDGKLYAIAPPQKGQNARLRWTLQTDNALVASSPAIAPDGTIYIGSLDGKLYALQPVPEGSPPKVRWTFSTGSSWDKGGIENSPAIGPDGTIYIGANNGVFYALDGQSGKVKWQFQTEFRTWGIFSSAALGKDGTVYVGPKDGRLLALDGKSGDLKWSYPIGTTIETSPLITPDGTVYLGADNGRLYAIQPPGFLSRKGRLKWSYQTQGTLISSPVIGPEGSLYIGSMDGNLYAFGSEALGVPRRTGPLSGTWYGSYRDSGSSGDITFVLVQQGKTVHGVWRLQGGRRGALEGKVSGDQATFVLTPMSEACPAKGEGTATIMANKLSGEYRGQHCTGEITHGVFTVER
jgi:outer membrane protein assembly factor BamB